MSDDRFSDLGQSTSAGDRLAELDEVDHEKRPEPPRRRGRYTWVLGVAAVIVIAVVFLNSARHPGRGIEGPPVGKPIPRFAAPSATGLTDGDPNINQTASDPAPGRTAACAVRAPGALRSCDYTSKPLVITFVSRTGACERLLDRMERVRTRFPDVNFLAIATATNKHQAAALVGSHGWRQPVAVDRNGALITLYRVSFCGTVVFAYRGGIVRQTALKVQDWSEARIANAVRATEAR